MKNSVLEVVNGLTVKNTTTVNRMPITKGITLTFVPDPANIQEHDATDGMNPWTGYVAVDGTEVSITALTRIGNGLELEGSNPSSRLQSLFTKFGNEETGIVVVNVKDVKERGGRFYPVFAVVA